MDIITPISPEYKKLLRDNPELSNLKEFFADYISSILSNKSEDDPNKLFVEKEDFENFEGYLKIFKNYKKVKQEDNADIIINVDNIEDDTEINIALLKNMKEKYWWLFDSFKGKKLNEKFIINTPFGKKEIYNFNNDLTEQNLKKIVDVFLIFNSIKNKEIIKNIKYIIINNEEKINPNDGANQNGENNFHKKYINIFPNAITQKKHRIGNFSNLKGTLIHEIGHSIPRDIILKFKNLFWKEKKEGVKIGKYMQYEIPINPGKCISDYAKTNSGEDLSESLVGYFMAKNKLDIDKNQFIKEYISGDNYENKPVTINNDKDLSFPKINEITYFIKKKKRKKFKIL